MAVGLFQDQRAFGEVLAHLAYPIVFAGFGARGRSDGIFTFALEEDANGLGTRSTDVAHLGHFHGADQLPFVAR